jgi:hypothetical protein
MSKQLPNIHDAFFKQALSDPLLAGTFLREHLPPEVAGLLGCEPPEPVPVFFVDEDGANTTRICSSACTSKPAAMHWPMCSWSTRAPPSGERACGLS